MKKIEIWTDGSCRGNPGPGGWAFVSVYNNKELYEDVGNKYVTTNNEMELFAIKEGLKYAITAKENLDDAQFVFYSDSAYAVSTITNWMWKWKENGWRKKGGEIKNLELIKEIYSLYSKCKDYCSIEKVHGHSGIEFNELVDRLAVD